MNYLLKALIANLQGEVEVAKAKVLVNQRSPMGP